MSDLLVFDFFSDTGHFKRYYTTSSPITFAFPPKTAIQGVLGAILGIEKESCIAVFQKAQLKVAIQILNPIKKFRMGIKWIKTSSVSSMQKVEPKPIVQEYLRDCRYRLYISLEDKTLFNDLQTKLELKQTFYSLCMGITECLAHYGYVGKVSANVKEISEQLIEVHSLIPFSNLLRESDSVDFLEVGKIFQKERCCVEFSSERQPLRFEDFLFETSGHPIRAKVNQYQVLSSGENIILF